MTRLRVRAAYLFLLLVVVAIAAAPAILTSAWEPFNSRHEREFFKKASFSLARHLEQREAVHRRLGQCEQFVSDHKKFMESLSLINDRLGVGTAGMKMVDQANHVLDVGSAIDSTQFDKYMKAGNALLFAGMGGLAVLDIADSFSSANEMKKQADDVFKLLDQIKSTVNKIPETLAKQFVLTNFNNMVFDSQSMADIVLNQEKGELIKSACKEFRRDKISTAATALDNYGSICDRTENTTPADQSACFVVMGETVGGALVRLLTAEATCAAYALADTDAPLRIVEDKRATMGFLSKVAKRIQAIIDDDGSSSGGGSSSGSSELDKRIEEYNKNISALTTDISDNMSFAEDLSQELVTALNEWQFTNGDIVQNIGEFTSGKLYQTLTESNSAAGQMATVVAMSVGSKFNQSMGKLEGIKSNIEEKHAIRVEKIAEIDKKVWTNHGETMGKINTMSTVFTAQHDVRMGRLSNIQSKVGAIQTRVTTGFQNLQGKISTMGSTWAIKINGIEQTIEAQGELTTSYLTNAISDATNQIGNRIDEIGTQVEDGHSRFMDALSETQQRTVQEYETTRDTLWTASDQLQQTIDAGMNTISDTAARSFDQVTDVVYQRMVEANVVLSNMLTGISGELALVDNKLVVLDNQVFEMSNQLKVAQDFLEQINYSFDLIANGLKDAMAGIRAVIFQERLDGLYEQYEKMRQSYQSFLTAGQDMRETIRSCSIHKISDLFLSMLDLVDIKDQDIPKHLEYFDFEMRTYELFGMNIIATLREVSFLDTVCAKIEYGPTPKDLEELAQEQADRILRAAGTLTRHVKEVIPSFLMNHHAAQRLEVAAHTSWITDGPNEAETLRNELQVKIGDFARVSVIHAGLDGVLNVNHLDLGFDYNSTDTVRRRGILLSLDKKLAVVWSNTKQLSASVLVDQQQQTKLLRQGIYRGSIKSTSTTPKCFISTAPGYYPVCDSQCKCEHYEDFASSASADSGRAVTYFESDAYDSDFTVKSTFDAGVNYYLESVAFTIRNLGPSATASISGTTIPKSQPSTNRTEVLWEGYTSSGAFNAFASGVMGKVLAVNELTLEINADSVQGKQFPLFCDGGLQKATDSSPPVELTYSCREISRSYDSTGVAASSSSSTFASVVSGVPTQRLESAVCTQVGNTRSCKMTGAVADLSSLDSISQLEVGSDVQDVTVYEKSDFKGGFAVCRRCSVADLSSIAYVGSVLIGIPEVKPELLEMECYQPTTKPNILYCRE